MSGGSYNYLSTKDADDVLNATDDLRFARDRLKGLGYADDASEKVAEILTAIADYRRDVNARLSEVEGVLHALEWWDSNDWGEDQFREALGAFRSRGEGR